MNRRAQTAAEGAEDVAPHPDRRGHEDQEPGKRLEGVGDGAEGQPGEEVTPGRNEERGKTLPHAGGIRTKDGARPRAETESGPTHGNSEGPSCCAPSGRPRSYG